MYYWINCLIDSTEIEGTTDKLVQFQVPMMYSALVNDSETESSHSKILAFYKELC